ncbi:MAG: SRPBCC family protein [Cyclobacteriaceae bacterium]
MLKKIIIAVVVIITIPLIAALFMDKEYNVEASIVVNKPKDQVFEYIKYLKNQNEWATWNQIDPNMKQTYSGTDGTVGFISAWESEHPDVGVGEQEITKIVEGSRVETELRFKVPFEATSPAYMTSEDAGNDQTSVRWGFDGVMPYPMNLLISSMKGQLETDFANGLAGLKSAVEALPEPIEEMPMEMDSVMSTE